MSTERWKPRPIDEVWLPFLTAADDLLEESIEIHCIGGLAIATLVPLPRPTGDVDFIDVLPETGRGRLLDVAGEGSRLAAKHALCFHQVGIVDPPCDYTDRLIDVTPEKLSKLRMRTLDPYDLILTKAQRGGLVDVDDARILTTELRLDRATLANRFEKELRPYLSVMPERTALTVSLWLDELFD